MVRRLLRCLLWGCLLTAIHPEPSTACGHNQYPKDNLCCDFCQPGEKLVKDCTESAPTECASCSRDEFQATFNKERRCHQHKYCDPNLGLRVLVKGTLKTDTICMCEEGQHCTGKGCERCSPHSTCSPGYGVKQMATGTSDTVCEPCGAGSFSNVSSASEKCNPWTSCEAKGLVEQQAGTDKTDVVCGFQNRMRVLLVIPIIMGVVLVGLLVSACIKKVAKKPEEEVIQLNNSKSLPVEMEDSSPVQETLHGCQPVAQEDGKESRISVQERL
ncbi:tumor necrosis factor receptor superfamily member 5 [Talpa occidentalis]|uniref:tumor necrosis factor receptor superfamily member 5 n=1 Tax=Talpa occidentalis TaxID=50954 RepID=UPI00188E27D8|nr:tumor necrosis factor receptor superfamily member 5 [Talpa occidentalis]